MGAGAQQSDRRVGRWLLVVAAAASLLAVVGLAPSGAVMTTSTDTRAGWAATGLLAPSNVAVSQTCRTGTAPVLRGSTFTVGDSSTTIVLATPAGVLVGDLLLAGVTWATDTEIPVPSGWTKVRNDQGNPLAQSVFYRVARAGDPTTHRFTHVAANKFGGIIAYSGVDPSSLLLPTGSSGQATKLAGGTITAPPITTRRPGTVVVGFFGMIGVESMTGDSRMRTRYTGSSNGRGASGSQVSVLAAVEPRPVVGDTGTRTATANGGAQVAGQLVSLEPPLEAHATVTWTRSTSAAATGQLYRRYAGSTKQREDALGVQAVGVEDGPLVPDTAYRVAALATAGSVHSAEAAASFTPRTCTDA